jgi:HEAT repeat protein
MKRARSISNAATVLSGLLLGWMAVISDAGAAEQPPVPDFTKGESIPEGFRHDWNLGATGARGWMFSNKLVTSDARQIKITKVAKGSPAEGSLAVGDVILGVDGKPFSYDPRTEFGQGLTLAESEAGGGKFVMTRWRDGRSEEVTIKLPVLGTYSANAPFDCPKSKRVFEQGCATLAKRVAAPSYNPDPILRSLNALALLASGKPEYLPMVRKEAKWASGFSVRSMATWYYGYVTLFLAEYKLATGDDSVMPGLRRLAMEAANGQSAVGSWGHAFARPDGRLGGYGMMNSPGVPLTISLVMARAAGVNDPKVSRAIERSLRLLRFYIGKGCVPYGDHAPWMETHEDNGKCGMAAVLFNLVDEPEGARFFAQMSLCSHGPERDCGHTGNYFNILWAMPGVALSGPHATGAWMKEFGAWSYDLAREWDGGFAHQGPPEAENDSYEGWDSTGAILLAYAMPLKSLWLTGKRPGKVPQIDAAAAEEFIRTGRGWNNKNRYSFYDKLSVDELLADLCSWSPIVRERAGIALGRRKDSPVARVVVLLDSPTLDARLGACQAIAHLKGRAGSAVPALRKTLHADDLWLRIKAADALAAIGKPAMEAVPEMLELLARFDPQKDPRGMQQRFFTFALFDSREGLLGRSLEGVDRQQLYQAVRAGLKNEDGRARSDFGSVYRNLSAEAIKPLLPAILQAAVEPAPSGEMFADGVRVEGLRVLAKHHVEEGIRACVDYIRGQNPWASEHRTPELTKILVSYGANAKIVVPELERIAADFADGEPDFPKNLSLQKAAAVREAIREIQASNDRPELIRIK